MHRAGDPIEAAQFVEDGAADANPGIGFKGSAVVRIEAAHGIKQADQSGAVEIVGVDMGGQRHGEASNHSLDQGKILFHQAVFYFAAVAGAGVTAPKFALVGATLLRCERSHGRSTKCVDHIALNSTEGSSRSVATLGQKTAGMMEILCGL